MSAQNKTAMRRLFEEAWNQGNYDAVHEILSSDFVGHFLPPEAPAGPDSFCAYIDGYKASFSDLSIQVDDMIAEGEKVVSRITARGTHDGPLMGLPPTGKEITITGMVIARFENGRYVEGWGEHDKLGLMQQLDIIPAPQ